MKASQLCACSIIVVTIGCKPDAPVPISPAREAARKAMHQLDLDYRPVARYTLHQFPGPVESIIKLDSVTGDTWYLTPDSPKWLPLYQVEKLSAEQFLTNSSATNSPDVQTK